MGGRGISEGRARMQIKAKRGKKEKSAGEKKGEG